MVFKRRMMKRKRLRRKTRRVIRRSVRVPRSNFLQTKRFAIPLILAGSDAIPANVGAQIFQFDQIPAFTEFTNTFDAYRLAAIRYRWVVIRSADQTGATLAGTLGIYTRVMWAYDFNDSTPPGTVSDVQQYNNVKEIYLTNAKPVSRWYMFKPKPLIQIAAPSYAPFRRAPFVRMNETNVPHYGIKYYYDGNQASQQLRLEAYYYFQLKSVR